MRGGKSNIALLLFCGEYLLCTHKIVYLLLQFGVFLHFCG